MSNQTPPPTCQQEQTEHKIILFLHVGKHKSIVVNKIWLPDDYYNTAVCGTLVDEHGTSYNLIAIRSETFSLVMNPAPVDAGLTLLFTEKNQGKLIRESVAGPVQVGEFLIESTLP